MYNPVLTYLHKDKGHLRSSAGFRLCFRHHLNSEMIINQTHELAIFCAECKVQL